MKSVMTTLRDCANGNEHSDYSVDQYKSDLSLVRALLNKKIQILAESNNLPDWMCQHENVTSDIFRWLENPTLDYEKSSILPIICHEILDDMFSFYTENVISNNKRVFNLLLNLFFELADTKVMQLQEALNK